MTQKVRSTVLGHERALHFAPYRMWRCQVHATSSGRLEGFGEFSMFYCTLKVRHTLGRV
jgi:hypothetical protein